MRRILVTDDERPVIETISLIVRRELAGEFEIVGTAMSGREAIEKAGTLAPDIVLMDVRMPGISGLDAIREMRKRGSAAVFILVTAYERFEIAREAVELGVVDYLLKPVSKDILAKALRNAAEALARRSEAERREIEFREREETTRGFVEAAFLHGIVLGESFGSDLAKYCSVLGLEDPLAVAGVATFLPIPGSPWLEEELRALHERFRATVRYKTTALAGPLLAGHAVMVLPIRDAYGAEEGVASLRRVLLQAFGPEMEKGILRLGFGGAKPLGDIRFSWQEALRQALAGKIDGPQTLEHTFEEDETFLECLLGGVPERARLSLERILEPLRNLPKVPRCERYRVIALFGAGGRMLARRGLANANAVLAAMDCEDLREAPSGLLFALATEAHFSALLESLSRTPRWSPLVARAAAFIHENFSRSMSLETTAYALGISPNRLSRIFSEETGKGFSDYLIDYRIEKAKEMLLQPGASIKQVSMSCGYPDPNYFSRLFKKVTGLTPTSFSSGLPEAGDGTI
jgi:two-component system response regulator YesN